MRKIAFAVISLMGSGLCAAPFAFAQRPASACVKPVNVEALQSVEQLPKAVQEALHQDAGELSPIGGPFDATDVVMGTPHFRRLLFIWHHDTHWLIATERGGIAYSRPIFLYEYVPKGQHAVRLLLTSKPTSSVCETALASIIR